MLTAVLHLIKQEVVALIEERDNLIAENARLLEENLSLKKSGRISGTMLRRCKVRPPSMAYHRRINSK